MFFINLGTCSKWMFTLLSLAQRILLLIVQCHTVTHGTELRRSALNELVEPVLNNLTVSQYDNTGPIKYLYAPNHQILVKSASRKARNRNKADFATKVRNQVKNVLM